MQHITIATRQSPLALWQANFVKAELKQQHPDLQINLLPMTTKGDQILDRSLAWVGGKGLFTKELETALLDGRADIAVHSMKDVPVELPAGLVIAAICERHDPRDVLITPNKLPLADAAIIGSSSLRRQTQIKNLYPNCQLKNLRGNVNSRLAKCLNGEYDGIVLAAAGVKRLDLTEHVAQIFEPEQMLPAAGQGILGVEARDDAELRTLLAPLHHADTAHCIQAERRVTALLGGSCHMPLAVYATLTKAKTKSNIGDVADDLRLRAILGDPSTNKLLQAEASGKASEGLQLADNVSDALYAQGAKQILSTLPEKK